MASTRTRPQVLIVYYSFSKQTERVADSIVTVLEGRGAEVTKARIEFTDKRWAHRFEKAPMKWPVIKIVSMLPHQIRQQTGEFKVPPTAESGDYDLVVLGSPTWWFSTSLPMRSYLKSAGAKAVMNGKPFSVFTTSRRYWNKNVKDMRRFGEANGGRYVDQTHFVAAGNQVTSMVSWLIFMAGLHSLEGKFGLPATNLQPGFEQQAERYIDGIADTTLSMAEREA